MHQLMGQEGKARRALKVIVPTGQPDVSVNRHPHRHKRPGWLLCRDRLDRAGQQRLGHERCFGQPSDMDRNVIPGDPLPHQGLQDLSCAFRHHP